MECDESLIPDLSVDSRYLWHGRHRGKVPWPIPIHVFHSVASAATTVITCCFSEVFIVQVVADRTVVSPSFQGLVQSQASAVSV